MTHTPLTMHGPTVGGKLGAYDANQIRDWIVGKLGLNRNDQKLRAASMSQIVNDFMSGKGKPVSGLNKHVPHGTFTKPTLAHTSLYHGKPVYHASSGTPGTPGGCTIFYVNSMGNTGKIIAIGQHASSKSYTIEWNATDWHVGRTVALA